MVCVTMTSPSREGVHSTDSRDLHAIVLADNPAFGTIAGHLRWQTSCSVLCSINVPIEVS